VRGATLATTMEVREQVVRALGTGFDLTSDFRLRFAKAAARRLVDLDEDARRDVPLPGSGGATLHGVPRDVVVGKGDRIRFRSDVLEFNQVSSIHSCFDPARSQVGTIGLVPCFCWRWPRVRLPGNFRDLIGRGWWSELE
jgi:hypothetical protein